MKRLQWAAYVILLSVVTLGLACSDDSPVSPDLPRGPAAGIGGGIGADSALPSEVAAALERGILDEYHAEQIYLRVIEDFGEVLPFTNVVYAEVRHSDSISRLYVNRGLPVPGNPWNRDNVPRFRSIPEACRAGADAEEQNVEMYEQLLRLGLPFDVRTVFTNNRRASLENHLPAFRFCS
jgi:hypothetical protein